jgi:hypothetical protein
MRLYDQTSGTPSQSSSMLDCKKWIRPKAFLPDPDKTTIILSTSALEKQRHPSTKDETDVSNPSPSNSEKQRMMETNFLFDIDEESSMNSSSTISTHTSFQRDLLGTGRLGLTKPSPSTENSDKIETVYEEKPFEVLHSTCVDKTKALTPKVEDHSFEQFKSLPLPLKESSHDEISYATRETEPTLVESSSEESLWLDFASEDFSDNPFYRKASSTTLTQDTKRVVFAPPRPSAVADLFGSSYKNGNPHTLAKYSAMMIRGHSVAEVTKIMAQDQVHPSIISLVMIAASENQQ